MEIRRAIPADAETLAALAASTFADTFAGDNDPEDLALHLAASYGAARQRGEIEDPGMRTLVTVSDDALVAFAQLRRGAPPVDVAGADPVEVWRFYVDRAWHGRGVAGALMDAALAEARAMGAGAAWLGVWERNPRAIAFYRKRGFVEVGTHVFTLGRDAQTDVVMARPL